MTEDGVEKAVVDLAKRMARPSPVQEKGPTTHEIVDGMAYVFQGGRLFAVMPEREFEQMRREG